LKAAGCTRIYSEKISGAKSDRPKLRRLLNEVDRGDVVIVCRLDRSATSTLDLLHRVDTLTKAGAEFRSLADTWCDTTTPPGWAAAPSASPGQFQQLDHPTVV